MPIPNFPETNHPMIKSLSRHSDTELLTLFQRHAEEGKYFTAIFCRYSPIIYTLVRNSAKSPVQADYLLALTWRHIYHELRGLDLSVAAMSGVGNFTLQNWLINVTALCINQVDLPSVESIHYSLKEASPPLWCYVQLALDQLPATLRLIIVMAQTFHWSEPRIAAYLQAEGENLSPQEIRIRLQEGYQLLEAALPDDIKAIYFPAQVGVG